MYLTKTAKKEIAERLCDSLLNHKEYYQSIKDDLRRLEALLDSLTMSSSYQKLDKEFKEIYTMAADMYYRCEEFEARYGTAEATA